MEEQLGASSVQFHVPGFIDREEVDPTVAGNGPGEVLLVSCFDELVHEPGSEGVFDPEALLRCRGSGQSDEEVRFSGAGIPEEAEWLAFPYPFRGGEGVDGGRVDVRVLVEVEIFQPFIPEDTSPIAKAGQLKL